MDPSDYRPSVISNWIKTLMTFIDRVGFPVLAFLLMWQLNIQLTHVIERLNVTLEGIKNALFMQGGRHY